MYIVRIPEPIGKPGMRDRPLLAIGSIMSSQRNLESIHVVIVKKVLYSATTEASDRFSDNTVFTASKGLDLTTLAVSYPFIIN